VAPWDHASGVGGDVYRWSLQKRYDLRDQFVFIASEVPAEFDRLVAGRCLAVAMTRPGEIVRVALAAVKRRAQLEAARDAAVAELDAGRPTLLLAEDDPVLLMVMADLLEQAGYAVSRVESGRAASTLLEHDEFDVIVVDWNMDDGSGADLYRWLCEYRPWLAERVVFLSGEEGDDARVVAPGRPMFRKGQDSQALTDVLREIIRQVRHERSQG
jgi:CheY-like chemotaxis protein